MMVRRYVVKDMPEAVLMIRKDLGKDAVILSSKRIRVKKWWGLWHTKRIEVLAATGDDVPRRPTPVTRMPDVDTKPTVVPQEPAPFPPVAEREVAAVEERTGSLLEPQVSDDSPSSASEAVDPSPEFTHMQREIAEIRSLLQSAMGQASAGAALPTRSPEQAALVQRMVLQGVDSATAEALLADAATEQDAVERVLLALQSVGEAQPIGSASRVCAFVGPTGVGKTTTVAKIAALHVLAGNRKVGLVTTDTYRIAAVEQLKTYAGILHVPLQVVQSPADFPAALDRLAGCDLILVDTAGRSYRTQEQVEEVQHLLSKAHIDETYLVMSLTSKPSDLHELARLFLSMKIDKFLFTKMDETESIGVVLNLLHEYQKPMSYITTGQNVPDDIDIPSISTLVRRIFGGVA